MTHGGVKLWIIFKNAAYNLLMNFVDIGLSQDVLTELKSYVESGLFGLRLEYLPNEWEFIVERKSGADLWQRKIGRAGSIKDALEIALGGAWQTDSKPVIFRNLEVDQ